MKSVIDLYVAGNSIPQVSAIINLPRTKVRNILKQANVLRSRANGVKIAGNQGRLGTGGRKGIPNSKETRKKISSSRLAWAEKHAKGVSLKPNGYLEITRGENKGRWEHRIIVERAIGRKLSSKELVHHDNEIKTDNNIENLKLTNRSEHAKHHAIKLVHTRNRRENGTFC